MSVYFFNFDLKIEEPAFSMKPWSSLMLNLFRCLYFSLHQFLHVTHSSKTTLWTCKATKLLNLSQVKITAAPLMLAKCEHKTLGVIFYTNIPNISQEIVDKSTNIGPILFCNRERMLWIVTGTIDNLYQILTTNAKLKMTEK